MEHKYCVIVEWKNESALVMESKPLDFDRATEKMRDFLVRPDVIRACVARLTPEHGNDSLLPPVRDTAIF